jgi:pentafunctional AROM polypeptide
MTRPLNNGDAFPPGQKTPLAIPILGNNDVIRVGRDMTEWLATDVLTVAAPRMSNYVVVTDRNLAALGHLDRLVRALDAIAAKLSPTPRVSSFVLPPGELTKCRTVKAHLEDALLERGCTRDTCMIALGGGVIGDLTGYVAATYMRGVPVIQIPTTLLAMVDSSIGGKTVRDLC